MRVGNPIARMVFSQAKRTGKTVSAKCAPKEELLIFFHIYLSIFISGPGRESGHTRGASKAADWNLRSIVILRRINLMSLALCKLTCPARYLVDKNNGFFSMSKFCNLTLSLPARLGPSTRRLVRNRNSRSALTHGTRARNSRSLLST